MYTDDIVTLFVFPLPEDFVEFIERTENELNIFGIRNDLSVTLNFILNRISELLTQYHIEENSSSSESSESSMDSSRPSSRASSTESGFSWGSNETHVTYLYSSSSDDDGVIMNHDVLGVTNERTIAEWRFLISQLLGSTEIPMERRFNLMEDITVMIDGNLEFVRTLRQNRGIDVAIAESTENLPPIPAPKE